MRRTSVVLLLGLALAVAGCGQPVPTSAAKPIRIAAVLPSATTDMAYSQSMYSALLDVQQQLGGVSRLQIEVADDMWDVPAAATLIRSFADQAFDVIVVHGAQYGSVVQQIAPDFPEVTFAWGDGGSTFGLPNVHGYTAAAEEGGYVNGVAAGMLTQTKSIGVIGPIETGEAKAYVDGFRQGVASVDSTIDVVTTWTGSFSDVALMAAAASAHIAAGADVLTGSSQSVVGAIAAAREAGGVAWFGTQSDQAPLAPQLVVASQVYDWTGMLKDVLALRQAGKVGGRTYRLQLNNGGLVIAFNGGYQLSDHIRIAAETAIADIKDGRITIKP